MKVNVNEITRKVAVDNRLPLSYYYRIADNLLKQANVYRAENNIVDLFVILLRFSSLMSDTIPYHKDYQVLLPKQRITYIKKLKAVVNELESLKPEFQPLWDALHGGSTNPSAQLSDGRYGSEPSFSDFRPVDRITYSNANVKQPSGVMSQPSWKYNDNYFQTSTSNSMPINNQFNKLSISLPRPKQETLSRHSILGPGGLNSRWQGPTAEIKVQYPNYADLASAENSSPSQRQLYDVPIKVDNDSEGVGSTMESVLALDDGRWSRPTEELISAVREDPFQFVGVRQPCPPPVLAQVQHDFSSIPPSKVADPRPGNGTPSSNSFQHLHVPVSLMEDFLRLARANTQKNLETCGILAGSLKNRVFYITTLIVPKQESTSDSCSTLNEEEIFEVQDKTELFPLGWIHTHPTQTCFMSSVDLHTHYSYQIMLPEAIAIVMAPTDSSSPHGIFHLSDPGGVNVIRNCQERGFHPHEEPLDGTPIYEHCSHVYLNPKPRVEIIDLR